MWNKKFETVFGKPRRPDGKILKRHRDLAASIQKVTETILILMINYLASVTKEKHLCIGGGVALNALANGKLYTETPFNHIHIFGAAGDSGAAIGAGLFTHQLLAQKMKLTLSSPTLYLGTSYTNDEVEENLKRFSVRYKKYDDEEMLLSKIVELLTEQNIIGWFYGRCEVGPRALGNRSILGLANPRVMKNRMNRVKRREQFRPFAGSVLQDYVHEYFEVPNKKHYSPYMNFCFKVKKNKRTDLAAIVHKDNTCRIQTVSKENGRYYRLLKKVYERTGSACILNTSFNIKGEPIVEHPRQAIEDFLKTKMDFLVIEDFLIERTHKE